MADTTDPRAIAEADVDVLRVLARRA